MLPCVAAWSLVLDIFSGAGLCAGLCDRILSLGCKRVPIICVTAKTRQKKEKNRLSTGLASSQRSSRKATPTPPSSVQALKAYRSPSTGLCCLAWRPGSEHTVATGAHDGAIRLWDLRSPLPLSELEAHEGKALAVAWRDRLRLVSGGSDAKLHLFSAPEPGTGVGSAEG